MKISKNTFLLLFVALISCNQDQRAQLSFDKCIVSYNLYSGGQKKIFEGHYISNAMELEAARRKLALCLCNRYILTEDNKIRDKILEIYKTKETYFAKPFETNIPFDTILANKEIIFDPTILID